MSVTAIGSYDFAPRERAGKFHAPLLYIGWDQHMMFPAPAAIPVPGRTTFAEMIATVLPAAFGRHPDFVRIDWARTQWFRGHTLILPRLDGTLEEHGFKHKTVLRFRTPGLEGLRGSCG